MERESIIQEAIAVMKDYITQGDCGIFFKANLTGDKFTTLFAKDGIVVSLCTKWRYFEVLGLTPEERNKVNLRYHKLILNNKQ